MIHNQRLKHNPPGYKRDPYREMFMRTAKDQSAQGSTIYGTARKHDEHRRPYEMASVNQNSQKEEGRGPNQRRTHDVRRPSEARRQRYGIEMMPSHQDGEEDCKLGKEPKQACALDNECTQVDCARELYGRG